MMHIHFETIDSTNRFAKDLVVANLVAEPIVVTANTQTAGKGSHGRTWYSEDEGGLYYTLILPDVIWLPDPSPPHF
ncbi:hypothetical protein EBR96_04075 [bacterium]|nr:hypothetical protein [bacterium]